MDRLHLDHLLFRIIIRRVKIIGHMELMTLGILLHPIMLAQPIDQLERLLLPRNGYLFKLLYHNRIRYAIPGPRISPQDQVLFFLILDL